MLEKKNLILNLIFLFILSVVFITTRNIYIFILLNILIYLYIYFVLRQFYYKRKEQEYIEKNVKVAREDIVNAKELIVLIIKKNKIVWANDNAYISFPHIKSKRDSNFLNENVHLEDEEKLLKYNNRIYKVLDNDNVYLLIEITKEYREYNKLQNNQTIIGFLQIDNMKSLEKTMDSIEFSKFYSQFEQDLFNMFIDNKVYYKRIDDKTFYLNFPYNYLKKCINNRFLELGDIIKKYHQDGIVITTTMGISYNYNDIIETGRKAQEALELAISRGGAQIVLFDNDEKIYFGGGFQTTKGSYRLRSRIINNTLIRTIKNRDIIYLATHEYPDYDAIASVLLMYNYLKSENVNVKILLDDEATIEEYNLKDTYYYEDIITSYVLDNTKQNLLLVLDTQSKGIISHPKIIDEIDNIIIIDHHQTPRDYFRGNIFSWIEPNASSTTELVMSILTISNKLTKDEFVNNLAILGILTDTNKFKYRTSYQTLDALMHLVENGGDLVKSLQNMYLPPDEFIEKQRLLSQMDFIGRFSILEIDETIDDILLSIVADEMSQIKGIEGSITISNDKTTEEHNLKYKVKIRTKSISAKNLIEEYGGGGHFLQSAGVLNKEEKESLKEKIKNLEI